MIDFCPTATFSSPTDTNSRWWCKVRQDGKARLNGKAAARSPADQFNTPHGIAVGGSPPRVFVSDRAATSHPVQFDQPSGEVPRDGRQPPH
jgi:hypothetical protein